jgi:hypothetical protein
VALPIEGEIGVGFFDVDGLGAPEGGPVHDTFGFRDPREMPSYRYPAASVASARAAFVRCWPMPRRGPAPQAVRR